MNIKKSVLSLIAIFLVSCLFSSFSAAEEGRVSIKVATVDVNRVLNESKEAKAKKSQLDAKANAAREKVSTKRKNLKDLEEKLKSESAREDSKEVKDLKEQAKDYARFIKDTEDGLKEEFLAMNNSLTKKALDIIKDYAAQKDYDLILDKGEQARGPVLYGTASADVTDDIIKLINR